MRQLKKSSNDKADAVEVLAQIAFSILPLTDDVDDVLNIITEKARFFLNSDASYIILLDEVANELYVKVFSGIITEEYRNRRMSVDEGLAGWVLRNNEVVTCKNYVTDPRHSPGSVDQIIKEGIKQWIGVPLLIDNKVSGVLFICNRSNSAFNRNNIRLARAFGNLASIALQNSRLYKNQQETLSKVADTNERLRQSNNIHEQFINIELRGEGPSVIADTLAKIIDNPVVIEDLRGKLLAVSFCDQHIDELNPEINKVASIVGLAKVYPPINEGLKLIQKGKQHVWMSPTSFAGTSCRRLVVPIIGTSEIMGYISSLETGRELSELDINAIQYAALVLALNLLKQKAIFEAEQRAKGNLIGNLISGDNTSIERLFQWGLYMGYDLTLPRKVMVMKFKNQTSNVALPKNSNEQKQWKFILDQLLNAMNTALLEISPQSIITEYNNEIIILAACDDNDEEFSLNNLDGRIALAIKQTQQRIAPHLIASVGIGCICREIKDYETSYFEAKKALDITELAGRSNEIVSLNTLGILGLLFEPHSYRRISSYSEEILDPLIRYDQEHRSNLMNTLSTFLAHNCSPKTTANILYIHENTLRHRLERIQELCNMNFRDVDDKFALSLALKFWETKQHI